MRCHAVSTRKSEVYVIKITCEGTDNLPLDAIEDFQGKLKTRTKDDIEKIIKSIKKYGFSFPFFIWSFEGHNYCLDGHGRIQALCELRRKGEDIPLLPVVYVQADSIEEAKNKLLRLNSQFGTMTIKSVIDFTNNIELNIDEINLPDFGRIDLTEHKIIDNEWNGMPEFSIEDKSGVRPIIIHFTDELSRNKFAELLNQKITEKTKSLWYPPQDILPTTDKEYY